MNNKQIIEDLKDLAEYSHVDYSETYTDPDGDTYTHAVHDGDEVVYAYLDEDGTIKVNTCFLGFIPCKPSDLKDAVLDMDTGEVVIPGVTDKKS